MKKTSNYNLNLYEVNDLANLTDGYNNSMNTLDTTVKTVSNSVAAETTRATKAESTLTTNLNSEITRAKGAESTLTTNLNAEVTRAKAAESTLTTNLNTEVKRAKAAETKLDSMVKDITCYVNVLSYGISTANDDNADLFQTAINDTTNKGLVLYIPNGTYKLSHKLSLPWYCNIIGQSKAGTILKFTSGGGLVADITDVNGYKTCVSCTLNNFTIEGSYDGYNTNPDVTKPTWNDKRYDWEYMALNYSGLGGWFTVCDINNIRITKFPYGLLTYQPFNDVGVYNSKYNNVYGDLRLYRNIDASYCHTGIAMHQSDAMLIGFDINHCYFLGGPFRMSGGFCSNGHSWATNQPWLFESGTCAENIEIEAIQSYLNTDNTYQFNSFVLIASYTGSSSATYINNLKLWNILDIHYNSGYNHGAIRLRADNTSDAYITNVSFGKNSSLDNPAIYPVPLFEGNKGTAVIEGSLNPVFTSIKDKTSNDYAFVGSATVFSGICTQHANMPKGLINAKGFNIKTFEHI